MKLLSIVIPVLNEEKYLPILLNTLVDQTDKNFEVIVVDGKSDDKTVEAANSYKDRLNLRVVVSEKRNLAHQRNLGGNEPKGDYVVFVDSDFILKNDFVGSCFDETEKTNADLIIPFSYPITKNPLWKIYFMLVNFFSSIFTFFGKPLGNGPGNLVKKESFVKSDGYSEKVFVFEDQYFFQTAKEHHLKIISSKNIRMFFSLRRIKEDGIWGYFYFNIYAFLHFMFKGPVYKKFYDYKMGGQEAEKS